jgi:Domain of unknown function (DUF4382)
MKPSSISRLPFKFIVFAICMSLFACKKNDSPQSNANPSSSVNIFLTDDPSFTFDHVFLNIIKVEIKAQDSIDQKHESEHQGEIDENDKRGDASLGWMPIDIHRGVYDILKFRNGLDTLFAAGSFASTKGLKKVRLTLGASNSVVFNGITVPLVLKGNDNFVVIKIDESVVQVNSGGLTNFWIDIDAGRSIKKRGNDFELKPNVKVFSKEKTAGIEGRILPKDAAAIVMAINGTDTATAKPESEGEFKFIGLKPGTYSLLYHATANNYLDATINNIIVSGKEDSKVNTLTLVK